MPKLSQESLKKRFPCDYCGKTFRTRQGLSGHIRFHHQGAGKTLPSTVQVAFDDYTKFMTFGLINYSAYASQIPKHEIASNKNLLLAWINAKLLLESFGIKPTIEDFKNFMIVGMATVHGIHKISTELHEVETEINNTQVGFASTILEMAEAIKNVGKLMFGQDKLQMFKNEKE
jgi:hypothetical protein